MSTMTAPAFADRSANDDRALVPGSLQRVRQMTALRQQGWSLDEIALRFMVSRERVRQILRTQGGPDPQDVIQARRRRAEQLAEVRIDALLSLWRAGVDAASLAGTLGLQAVACRSTIERFATDVDRAARSASLAGARVVPTYSDRDIILALTSAAARLGRVPTAKEYAAVARTAQLPSLTTVHNRMGGWSKAVAAAGLSRDALPSRPRPRQWTDEACWEALRRAADELGELPSVLDYERVAAGRSDLPSSTTIRNRLGRWTSLTARLAAQRELARQVKVRAQSAAGALVRG
jgi:hypothetical protein